MLRFFSIFILSFTISFAIDINSIEDLSKFAPKSDNHTHNNQRIGVKFSKDEFLNKEELNLDDLSMIAPTDEPELMLSDELVYQNIRPTKLTLKSSDIPKSVYLNEIFKIDLKADMGQDIVVDLNLSIDKNKNLKWINQNSLRWIKGNGIFETTLWFEALSSDAKLNKITMTLNRNGEFFQEESIEVKLPTVKKIEKRDNFANISADELKVRSYKTSKFDDNSNIMTIDLSVKNANLSSFYIDDEKIIKQGVDSIRGGFDNSRGYYFAVIDNNLSSLNFNYFNLRTKKFENFMLDVKVLREDLSTQIGLNPKESKFVIYKEAIIYTIIGLLLVMFVASKNITPLIFAVIILIGNFLLKNSYENIIISKNTPIKILPMDKSTVFYLTKNSQNVEVFAKNGDFYKIMLKDGKIGWVDKGYIE